MITLAEELATAMDPVQLARRCSVNPDPWQAAVLRSTKPRLALNCCRQSGKSTTAALLALHRAIYVPGSEILLVSPGQRQSSELFKKVLGFYRRLGRPVTAEAENQMSLALDNGSRVISLPGNESTIRGYAADVLVIDEAARVEDRLYASVLPMLAVSGGRLIAMSTPYGISGWWARAWHDYAERWTRWRVPADKCPRITQEVLDEALAELGEWSYRQEFWCEFMADEFSVFSEADIAALAENTTKAWRL